MYCYLQVVCLLVALVSFLFTVCPGSDGSTVTTELRQCWQCTSEGPAGVNPLCPADSSVDPRTYKGPCKGLCFSRTGQSPAAIFRGCTEGQWGLPDPLPSQGCYTWQARSQLWCFCDTDGCNGVKMGQGGNVTLEDYVQEQRRENESGGDLSPSNHTHLLPPSFRPGDVQPAGALQCWQCLSFYEGVTYTQCPLHGQVDVARAYIGNCTGTCFMRTSWDSSGVEVMQRGCTTDQWGLPYPLPTEGCYTWQARSQVWCFCSTHGCNGVKMGEGGNVTLEEFVEEENRKNSDGDSVNTVLPPWMSGVGPSGALQCWECQSYSKGQSYPQCPLHGQVNVNTVYMGNCTGRCVMHNASDTDTHVEVMHRGCSSSLYGLPDPLPADGCYSWHGEVWCICNVTGCNGVGLGVASVEFNAHISNSATWIHDTALFFVTVLFTILFF